MSYDKYDVMKFWYTIITLWKYDDVIDEMKSIWFYVMIMKYT